MGLIARAKNWVFEEVITFAALNAEFNNILNNLIADKIDDHSANVAQMQELFDLGDVGIENLPESTAEELKGLRSMIKKITGEAQYYVPPQTSMATINASIGVNLGKNRILSGKEDASGQPQFLVADGSTLNLVLEASPVNLLYAIGGQEFTKSTDDSVAVPTGFSSGKTAVYADTVNTGSDNKFLGEIEGTKILLSSVGSSISSRDGLLSAFKFTNGTTEYFLGVYRDDGSQTFLKNCRRGFFFNSSGAGQRVQLASSQSITIMRLSYIFLKKDGTFTFNQSNNEPFVGAVIPPVPSIEDYWFDTANKIWKIYNGSTFIDAEATFIGYSAQDTGQCEATRSLDFMLTNLTPECDISIERISNSIVRTYRRGGRVNNYGAIIEFHLGEMSWDMGADLDSGVSEASSTRYYFYIDNDLNPKISDISPYDRQNDLKGWYHPHKPWRCIGFIDNDGSSNFDFPGNYGSEDYIADHSLSLRKLRPYRELADDGGARDLHGIGRGIISIGTSGNDGSVTLVTSGRPVLIFLTGGNASPDGVVIGSLSSAEFVWQRRLLPGGAWTPIGNPLLLSEPSNDRASIFPHNFLTIDIPAPGQHEWRLNVNVTSGTVSLTGIMRVIEL